MAKPIRVLVVDDSVFMRTVLKSALGRATDIEVIGSAQNGQEALKKIEELKPDVVTLDIEMPGLTGLDVLDRIMPTKPLPVVVVSTKTQAGAKMTFEALDKGAVDYVAKPLADKNASLKGFQDKVIAAVRAAFASNRSKLGKGAESKIIRPRTCEVRTEGIVVAIGISAGGPATLHKMIPLIPANFPPIVLTQHMPADFTGPFAKRLDASSQITVKEAEQGDELIPGRMLLAHGGKHLRVIKKLGRLVADLGDGPKVSGFKPSVDVLFESVTKACGANVIGLVMTGMGTDGANGIKILKEAGATTLSQDQESSIVYGMPKAAFETGCIDKVLSLAQIPDTLVRLLSQATAKV